MHATDAAPAAPGGLPLQAWSAEMFAKRELHSTAPILSPVLARGSITLVSGPRGTGKSWLALSMAHVAASGGALLGWTAPAPCRVVYLDVCGSQALLRERLAAITGGSPSPNLAVVPGDAQAHGLPDPGSETGIAALDALATDADLVVLDGVTALVRGGRGIAARWQALALWLRGLRRRGLSVLLVDRGEPRPLLGLADTVLSLARPLDFLPDEGARFQVHTSAARGLTGLQVRRFEARLSTRDGTAAWVKIDALDEEAILAWRLHQQGFSTREIARRFKISNATGWRLVERGKAINPALRDLVLEEPSQSADPGEAVKQPERVPDIAAAEPPSSSAFSRKREKECGPALAGNPRPPAEEAHIPSPLGEGGAHARQRVGG